MNIADNGVTFNVTCRDTSGATRFAEEPQTFRKA